MIKRNNKKGFTIVELVIVIAVIAILAAVLIPTFAGIIRKANISADTQLVKNMNTALAADEAINGPAEDFNEVIAIVRDAGYVLSAFNPTTEGCYVVWDSKSNQLLLVDSKKDFAVIYSVSDDYAEPGATWYFAVDDTEAKAALTTKYGNTVNIEMAITDAKGLSDLLAAEGDQEVYIDESLALDPANLLVFNKAGTTTINLGSASLNTDGVLTSSTNIIPIEVKQGTVNFNGGTIAVAGEAENLEGIPVSKVISTAAGTTVNFNGTTFNNVNTNGQIKLGGNATLTDVVITATKVGVDTQLSGIVTINNATIKMVNGSQSNSYGAWFWACNYNPTTKTHEGENSITVNSGTFTRATITANSGYGGIVACGGDVIINGGTFTAEDNRYFTVSSGKIVISADSTATFGGKTAKELGVDGLKNLCHGFTPTIVEENGAFTITK